MIPYENQMLGAFVYALGYESGKQGHAVMANLFQQTPLDGTFGDLVAGSDWCLAIEFKRELGTLESERAKWSQPALSAFRSDPTMLSASRQAHLLCYGVPQGEQLEMDCMLYASALGLSKQQRVIPSSHVIYVLVALATSAKGVKKLGLPPDQLEHYLRKLSAYRKTSSGGRDSSWLAVASTPEGYRFQTASTLEALVTRSRPAHHQHEQVHAKEERKQEDDRER